jgi:hypothetical protein
MPDRWVILFESVYYVMKAEQLLKEDGRDVRLIPVPRDLSSDCGMAIEVSGDSIEPFRGVLDRAGIACWVHDRSG